MLNIWGKLSESKNIGQQYEIQVLFMYSSILIFTCLYAEKKS